MTNSEYHDALERGFTIVIPTWNNDNYLDMCIDYIKKHSKYDHEILVFLNGCTDNSREVCEKHNVAYVDAEQNYGICVGVNALAQQANKVAVSYVNDDMLVMPGWDTNIVKFCREYDVPEFSFLTGTMVEPKGDNPVCLTEGIDYGETWDTFDEERFMKDLPELLKKKPHQNGTCWVPSLWPTKIFNNVGGLDEAYSPGRGSDPDIAAVFYNNGCRHFFSVGDSLAYHFAMITTPRMDQQKRTDPGSIFYNKHANQPWGPINYNEFLSRVLKRGTEFTGKPIPDWGEH